MTENPAKMDEYTLLCERCGYVIEGLPTEGNCPECGKAIAESLPSARVGSAWQRHPSASGWLTTIWQVLVHPVSGWTEVRIDGASSRQLCIVHTASAAGIAAFFHTTLKLSSAIHFFDAATTSATVPWLTIPLLFVCSLGLWYWVIWLLVAVERRGVRFIGARHKWRITRDVAITVCAHAAAAWIVVVLATIIGWMIGDWINPMYSGKTPRMAWLAPYVQAAGFLLGLTYFETLVYIGIRRCKYVNRARPPA